MVFSTYLFICWFLPLVLVGYYALSGPLPWLRESPALVSRLRNAWLLCASYVFYGWWNPWFVLLMLGVTLINYVCVAFLARPRATARQRWWSVAVAAGLSLALLGFFKYFTFLQTNVNALFAWWQIPPWPVLDVLLPIGISFYTFQALSYTVDVYRGVAVPARSVTDFACYIALFPQLIAGPIVRYVTVAGQLVARAHRLDRFSSGVALFILGLAKKVLLANPVGELADAAFGAQSLCAGDAWYGVGAYAFQIYFDFCGYSDMAVGLGRMFGFEFLRNFDAPYRAESITDFWRRWHISLSTFLRDYLYIPLGGNRHGPRRTYVNLTIVMLLGGLWHGANWTFLCWGAYHGLWLAGERMRGKRSWYDRLPAAARVACTWVLVLGSWVIFRAPTLTDAGRYFGWMSGLSGADATTALPAALFYAPAGAVHMVVCLACVLAPVQAHDWAEHLHWGKVLLLLPLFAVTLVAMFTQSFSPFLYFQF